jgi:hypothetical protein
VLTLLGFSKGCVVLNQLVHEFHHETTRTTIDHSVIYGGKMEVVVVVEGGCYIEKNKEGMRN